MKIRILILLSVIFFVWSCKNEQKQTSEQIETTTPAQDFNDASHNSENSLNWGGTYTGTTPCHEPCKGIETAITINLDSTYTLSIQAMGQEEKPRTFAGKFYWDKNGSIITLDANGDHHKFKVQEGSLKELDKFGDPKQLGEQDDYILKNNKPA